MTTAKQLNSAKFHIRGIEILGFEAIHPDTPLSKPKEYNYDISLTHKINPEQSLVFVIVGIEIFQDDKKTKLGSIKVNHIFKIDNFYEVATKQDDKDFSFPENTIASFNSMAISTSRGVMFTTFRGTFLHDAILPVIDIAKLKANEDN